MAFVEIAGAVGLGALSTKLLDIIWLQRVIHRQERQKWLREQRLRVYSKLAEEIVSLGKERGTREDFFKAYAFLSEAILLVDNKDLANKLETYFLNLHNLYLKASMDDPDVPLDEIEGAYKMLLGNSKELLHQLRISLQNT